MESMGMKKTLNVLGIIVAWLLSIVMVLMLLVMMKMVVIMMVMKAVVMVVMMVAEDRHTLGLVKFGNK